MLFPPPPLFQDEKDDKWENDSVVSPAAARAEASTRAISEPLLDLKTVSRLARRGIPDKLRPDYWRAMIGYLPPLRSEWDAIRVMKSQEYIDIVRNVCKLEDDGFTVSPGKDVHRIDVDIPRTMPSLHFFACEDTEIVDGTPVTFSSTQQSLRRILHTLARVNKGFGYVQGMNELVGHLLFTFAEGKACNVNQEVEADTFFCFQSMLSILGDNFCRSLDFDRETGVMSTMRTFDRLVEFCDPELWDHITNVCQIRPEFYAFRWLTLLLTQEFLVPDVLRIWDYLLSFGSNMSAALYYFAIGMLIHQREELLAMENMSQMLPFLQQFPPVDVGELQDVAQKLMDEYGIDTIRQIKAEVADASKPANMRKSSSGSSLSEKDGQTATAVAVASAALEEVGQKLGGLVSAMRGWGKSLSKSGKPKEDEGET